MKITLVVDNTDSWMMEYINELKSSLEKNGHNVIFCNSHDVVNDGDIAVFLSCEKIVNKSVRAKNKSNIVVHSSALPNGKGWSPLTWQILEGKNKIPITLFEVADKVDSGCIYIVDEIELDGTELIHEMRKKMARKINEMIIKYIDGFPMMGRPQIDEGTKYRKRTKEDSKLDLNKTIKEQFNLLRVVDNERYPAFFDYMGKKYIVKIEKDIE